MCVRSFSLSTAAVDRVMSASLGDAREVSFIDCIPVKYGLYIHTYSSYTYMLCLTGMRNALCLHRL